MKNSPLTRRWIVATFAAWLSLPVATLAQAPPPVPAYDPSKTAILLVDPYNDFLAEGGKLWPLVKSTADAVGLHEHLKQLLAKAREAGIQIVYVPHHHTAEGDFDDWKFLAPSHVGAQAFRVFEKGSWGAEYHADYQPQPGDLEARHHWTASGFANTDLDFLLKSRGIDHVVLAGLRANTCIESTGRYAVELGYHVTLVKDAIAAFGQPEMDATINVNFPAFGHAVVTTESFLGGLGVSKQGSGQADEGEDPAERPHAQND
ncbi:MAG: cysteine hydrolase [Chloroflexi bacterium]|nr:cysteine hydrolase [Chloroflexota bacterium]